MRQLLQLLQIIDLCVRCINYQYYFEKQKSYETGFATESISKAPV